jgi:hypothetical protein
MPPEPNSGDVAISVMQELVKQVLVSNEIGMATAKLLLEMRDVLKDDVIVRKVLVEKLDELCGRIEVFSIAADILSDVGATGKTISAKDIAHAFNEASRDVFPDEDDGDDDDDDEGGDSEPVDSPGGSGRRRV